MYPAPCGSTGDEGKYEAAVGESSADAELRRNRQQHADSHVNVLKELMKSLLPRVVDPKETVRKQVRLHVQSCLVSRRAIVSIQTDKRVLPWSTSH